LARLTATFCQKKQPIPTHSSLPRVSTYPPISAASDEGEPLAETGDEGGNGNSAVAVHGGADEVREAARVQTSRRVGAKPRGKSTTPIPSRPSRPPNGNGNGDENGDGNGDENGDENGNADDEPDDDDDPYAEDDDDES
jgi:hypothetical protein